MMDIGAWEKNALATACEEATEHGLESVWIKPTQGLVGKYVLRAGRFTDANTTYHEMAFYTVVGAYFARKLSFLAGARPTYANIYALVIGPSSVARKSTVLDLAGLLAEQLEIHTVPSSITPEQLHDHLAGHPRALYLAFEVARFFALARRSYGAGIVEFLLELYDSPKTMVRETVSRGRVEIHEPHFSFLGAGVPAQVRASMGAVDVTGGLAPRFVWVLHQASPLQDFVGSADLDVLHEVGREIVAAKAAWPGVPLALTAAAQTEMAAWQHWLATFLSDALSDMGASFAARYSVITMKLAAIHAALVGSTAIEVRHVRDGAFAIFKTLRTVDRLGEMLRTDAKTSVIILRVIEHVRTAGTITRYALLQKMIPTVTAGSLDTIIKTLTDGQLIEETQEPCRDEQGEPSRGRPTTYYKWRGTLEG